MGAGEKDAAAIQDLYNMVVLSQCLTGAFACLLLCGIWYNGPSASQRGAFMKAAVLYGARDVRTEDVEMPRVDSGDVLIRVRACGICGSDLSGYRQGLIDGLGASSGSGQIIGHEFSGEIAKIGGQVEGLAVGDRVTSVVMGGNAEYVRIPSATAARLVIPLPRELSFEEAATNEPLANSLHVTNLADPSDDDTIVIIGAGVIGLGVLQVIRARCAATVYVIDLSDKRLDMAMQLGANYVIDAKEEDPYEKILEMTGSTILSFLSEPAGGADIVCDCAGYSGEVAGPASDGVALGAERPSSMWDALRMVKENGKVVVIAFCQHIPRINPNIIVRKGLRVIGSWAWTKDEFVQSLELMRSGVVNRRKLITHEFPLDQAKEAFETQLRVDEAIKVLIKP